MENWNDKIFDAMASTPTQIVPLHFVSKRARVRVCECFYVRTFTVFYFRSGFTCYELAQYYYPMFELT